MEQPPKTQYTRELKHNTHVTVYDYIFTQMFTIDNELHLVILISFQIISFIDYDYMHLYVNVFVIKTFFIIKYYYYLNTYCSVLQQR